MKSTIPSLFALLLTAASAAVQAQVANSTNADGSIYTYTTNADGTANIAGYSGPPWAVTIPTNLDGLTVTSINSEAFDTVPSLTNITIPGTVTSIGERAFHECRNLTNVTLPLSLTSIGDGAFWSCSGLRSVTVPDCITNFATVFADSALTIATIDYGVTNIAAEEFQNCSTLTTINIPSTVTSIGQDSFSQCTSLTSIRIPAGVTNIGNNAFANCTKLTNATLSTGLVSIGAYAFSYCSALAGITIPASVTNIGEGAFYNCASLTNYFFQGNAPSYNPYLFTYYPQGIVVYYLSNSTGWSNYFSGRPTALWNPLIQTSDGNLGVSNNQFGFNIVGTTNIPIVLEVCTNLANPSWTQLQTLRLTNGLYYFSEPFQMNSSGRYYRISSP